MSTKQKINVNSSENQEIKQLFVENHVNVCLSGLFDDFLKAKPEIMDDLENLYVPVCINCGESREYVSPDTKNPHQQWLHCSICDEETETEEQAQDVFEWWEVSPHLYRALRERNEPVIEYGQNHIWGRTCTGQAVFLDDVISCICADRGMLK